MGKRLKPRIAAIRVVNRVIQQHESLSKLLPEYLGLVGENERGLMQEYVYGVLRWHQPLEALSQQLMEKPLRRKDSDLQTLLLTGLYQIQHMRTPDYAAVDDCVASVRLLNKRWAKGMINAVLRRYLRERASLDEAILSSPVQFAHPEWLVSMLCDAWPEQWEQVCTANNQRAPMTLRVNALQTDRTAYLAALETANIDAAEGACSDVAIQLAKPCAVEQLPHFADGHVSVQDEAAQLATDILAPQAGERILDACAAPGGKSCHLLETAAIDLTAIDVDATRLTRVHENLQRLGLAAQVVAADAAEVSQWWDGKPFDRILLDAPCSGTGVIRRHPDIKSLRREEDIAALVARQRVLLAQLWPLLKPGGVLLYCTCSILPQENEAQLLWFREQHDDAVVETIDRPWGMLRPAGRQVLTGDAGMDGFYYGLIAKRGAQ